MRIGDAHGNPMTASHAAAVAAFDATVSAYLGFRKDTGEHLKAALEAEPDFLMGHCLRGYFMMLFGQRALLPRAERAFAAARAAAQQAEPTAREGAHLAALETWIAGDLPGAAACWERILGEHPHDALALRLAQYGNFYTGDSARMRAVVENALPAWNADMPDYGFVLGTHAFGLEETGDYEAAERAGRRAIEINSGDIWAAHAVAHVLEMTGRPKEGDAWIAGLAGDWRACNNFAYHALWHRALFLIELGRAERVLAFYDREVRPESTDDLLDISNAVSLLWRLEEAGIDVGERWQELAERSAAHVDDHLLTFGDIHYLMALAAAGKSAEAAHFRDSLARYAGTTGETEAAVARDPGLALADAVVAHRRGDFAEAADALASVHERIHRIGGSHAQRDLFEEMLIDAALRAGDFERAKALLAERVESRPRNAWGWRHYAEALAGLGDREGAAAARAAATRLTTPI